MTMTTISTTLRLPNVALAFALDALSAVLQTVSDQRDILCRRYELADLLLAVLAKLAGQDSSRAVAISLTNKSVDAMLLNRVIPHCRLNSIYWNSSTERS